MVSAYCNHNRWVAECGTPYCAEAHLVEPGDRFVCGNCDRSYDVSFPTDRVLIDAALGRRVVPQTRNWVPGETVANLVAENEAHMDEGVVV